MNIKAVGNCYSLCGETLNHSSRIIHLRPKGVPLTEKVILPKGLNKLLQKVGILMKRKISVVLAVLLMLSVMFSFGVSAASVEPKAVAAEDGANNLEAALALGDSYSGVLSAADETDTFTYTGEGETGYVTFAIEADENADTVKGGWIVEICDEKGEVLRTTTASLDEEGKLPKWKKFACADINGTYTVKVSSADKENAPVDTEYTLRVEQVNKFKALFDKFLGFDLAVFEWVQSIQGKFMTALMVTITTLGDEGILFIAMGLVLLFTKKYRKVGFAILIALIVMSICNNVILKDILARPRPFNLYIIDPEAYSLWGGEGAKYFFPNLVHAPSSYSFPSGHTSSAFAAAFAILIYNRKIGIPMTFFAALMGFSRIYVEVHYCTDVIAGAVVGLIYALIAAVIIKLVYPYVEKLIDKALGKLKKEKKA